MRSQAGSRSVPVEQEDAVSGATVLVVDDEPTIVEVVARYLERDGYRVLTAATGPEALSLSLNHAPDLLVLDIMLPEIDGLQVMRILRDEEMMDPAVILLTSKAEESDRLVGFRRGADDYVVKPFSPAELVARVASVLRRAHPRDPGESPIHRGDLVIDPSRREVTLAGSPVTLTQLEFDLLAFLARHPGRVFTRDQLMMDVWGDPAIRETGTVTVHIRRLRAKLEPDPSRPTYLETVWGVGYRFRS